MNHKVETYVLCEVAETTYAIRSSDIQHIQMLEHLTPVPKAAPFVDGIIFSRGQVVAAVNLRKRFGLPEEPPTNRTRVIITRSNNRQVGLIVDAAREFRAIPEGKIQPIDEAVIGIGRHFLRGIAEIDERLVLIFDLDAILSVSDLPDPDAAEEAAAENLEKQGSPNSSRT
jgi:purine-binding chemotaxis protein CheW